MRSGETGRYQDENGGGTWGNDAVRGNLTIAFGRSDGRSRKACDSQHDFGGVAGLNGRGCRNRRFGRFRVAEDGGCRRRKGRDIRRDRFRAADRAVSYFDERRVEVDAGRAAGENLNERVGRVALHLYAAVAGGIGIGRRNDYFVVARNRKRGGQRNDGGIVRVFCWRGIVAKKRLNKRGRGGSVY